MKKVEPRFGSIYKAVEEICSKTSFLKDTATQITLNGILDNQPLYVKIEEGSVEVAPYEYINAPFYIDADAEAFAKILNKELDFYKALSQGKIVINGNPEDAVLFVKSIFG
ncbi:MAG: SCP2 sterol-binding domain-containing protein [Saccharofermentans sp.]|nr:SCP2 sterol-binding domain-containing protein [Saccharofermentans sp.]